jgi:cobalt/nickel transport system permease protein
MHLMDGVLSAPVLTGGFAIAGALCAWSAMKIRDEEIPRIAVLTAGFFVASLIHFRVGLSSVHLTFHGLVGVVLGRRAPLAFLVGLYLQAALLQHGGFTVLGVNTCIFAIPALIVWPIFRFISNGGEKRRMLAGFICGSIAVLLSGFLWMLVLITTDEDFKQLAYIVFVIHIPLMIIEGIITGFTIQYLSRVQPMLLKGVKKCD